MSDPCHKTLSCLSPDFKVLVFTSNDVLHKPRSIWQLKRGQRIVTGVADVANPYGRNHGPYYHTAIVRAVERIVFGPGHAITFHSGATDNTFVFNPANRTWVPNNQFEHSPENITPAMTCGYNIILEENSRDHSVYSPDYNRVYATLGRTPEDKDYVARLMPFTTMHGLVETHCPCLPPADS